MASISALGVCPSHSRGKRSCSWWVAWEKRDWAIEHTAARHRVARAALVFVVAEIPGESLKRTRYKALYYTLDVIQATGFEDVG